MLQKPSGVFCTGGGQRGPGVGSEPHPLVPSRVILGLVRWMPEYNSCQLGEYHQAQRGNRKKSAYNLLGGIPCTGQMEVHIPTDMHVPYSLGC